MQMLNYGNTCGYIAYIKGTYKYGFDSYVGIFSKSGCSVAFCQLPNLSNVLTVKLQFKAFVMTCTRVASPVVDE